MTVTSCLADVGIPSIVVEKFSCIASLWQNHTYYRLYLHLPKQFSERPLMGFPKDFPKYPSNHQFISYMESHTSAYNIQP
ncbi:hypothetical protein Cni_G01444 [Canna indica]|uniref:indole-3-pyruvate monooxygenase n=1 Tax=Canna indica TaxID=4628 RepID=A0AAQ3PYN8_9LILI|nr:hypothetical protein Cni_G01444 [Canna indica]